MTKIPVKNSLILIQSIYIVLFLIIEPVLLESQSFANSIVKNSVSVSRDGLQKIPGRPDGWAQESHHKNTECNYNLVFDDTKVHQIQIIIPPEEYKNMEDDVAKIKMGSGVNPVYVPVIVIYNGNIWRCVGMRYKGNSTLTLGLKQGHKLPFRLDFEKYEDMHPEISDQAFYGFKELIFSNNYYDTSFLREKVCGDIFRQGGVPSARSAFYRVFIDIGDGPVYWGLYTMLEEPSDAMLYYQFTETDNKQYSRKGNLYKPEGEAARLTFFDEKSFVKKTNTKAGDFYDIQAVITALHGSRENADLWRARLESVFSVDSFIRWLAVNTAIVNWDSYGSMAQNYYLYQNLADGGRLVWFPWDLNMSMDLNSSPSGCLTLALNDVEEDWPLIRYIMDDPLYNRFYHKELAAALESCVNETWLIPYITKLHKMIRPYVIGDEGETKGYTFLTHGATQFDQALNELIHHIKERNRAVRNYLNSLY
ncbi:MAG: CotH kinase family protein [Spirochaetales bacterium]|nr:CotH kinase family protein [Spirochaetales bacterium]